MGKLLEFPRSLADAIIDIQEHRRELATRAAEHHRQIGHDPGPFWRCDRDACQTATEILEIPRGIDLLPAELA